MKCYYTYGEQFSFWALILIMQQMFDYPSEIAWIFIPIHLLSVDCNYMETWFIAKIAVLASQPEKENQAEINK